MADVQDCWNTFSNERRRETEHLTFDYVPAGQYDILN